MLVFRESITLIAPVEEFEEVLHFGALEARVGHGHPVLAHQLLRYRIALLHLLGLEQPLREPGIGVPLGYSLKIRSDLLAAAHRVTQDALGLEGELAPRGFRVVELLLDLLEELLAALLLPALVV